MCFFISVLFNNILLPILLLVDLCTVLDVFYMLCILCFIMYCALCVVINQRFILFLSSTLIWCTLLLLLYTSTHAFLQLACCIVMPFTSSDENQLHSMQSISFDATYFIRHNSFHLLQYTSLWLNSLHYISFTSFYFIPLTHSFITLLVIFTIFTLILNFEYFTYCSILLCV